MVNVKGDILAYSDRLWILNECGYYNIRIAIGIAHAMGHITHPSNNFKQSFLSIYDYF